MKDIGVSVTSELSWNSHKYIVSKCNIMMGIITLSVGYKAPINVTSYLYSTHACSNITHFSTVWNPFYFTDALVYIQRAATRIY